MLGDPSAAIAFLPTATKRRVVPEPRPPTKLPGAFPGSAPTDAPRHLTHLGVAALPGFAGRRPRGQPDVAARRDRRRSPPAGPVFRKRFFESARPRRGH